METQLFTGLKDLLVASFPDFEERLNGTRLSPIHTIRREALQAFNVKGFPTIKDEEWKYTNIQPIVKEEWQVGGENDFSGLNVQDISKFLVPNLETNLLVFINGQFVEGVSKILDEGVIITSLQEGIKHHQDITEAHFAKYLSQEFNSFAALNTAYSLEGAFIHAPQGKVLKYPVQLLILSGYEGEMSFRQLRNLIVAGPGVELTVIENCRSFGHSSTFTNIVTEISVGENAKVNYHKLQAENSNSSQVNITQIEQAKNSLCNTSTITIGGKMVRNDLNFRLAGKNCESHLYGVYLPAGNEHFDNHTFVDHAMPNCYSNELYKGIAMDEATAVFNGKIMVREDAQKTNAYQSNKNVLLSPNAHINTKPQLEIFADDVKCSHGATVGQLDEEALFYLRSRGIGEAEAKVLLTYAFAGDVVEKIALAEYREFVKELVREKLSR